MGERKGDRVEEQIGPYRLTRLLGAGGFGEVYEAEHQLIQQRRAIKLLLERHFHDPKQRERFLREARTLAGLEHSNILPVLEVDEAGDQLYLVMPLYQRGTLSDLLKQQTTPLPLTEVERALTQICAALGYAHQRGIAHLDLKPENLLLHKDGRLVLADFGLAHLLKQGHMQAGSSAFLGTPYYMAPEQFRGEPEPRSDLYALGVILYQLLTLQRPFTGTTPEALLMKHVLEAPPALQAAYPAAPAVLEPVVQKALAKQPADRYQTAGALLIDFRAALGSPAATSTQPPAPAAAPTPPTAGPTRDMRPTVPAALNTPPAAAAAGCELLRPDGSLCGIPPIGRCATCGRAFCRTHHARDVYWDVDWCTSCQKAEQEAERLAEQKKQEAKQAEEEKAREYIESGAARMALLKAKVRPMKIYWVDQKKKYGYWRGDRLEQKVTAVGRGWTLDWFYWRTTPTDSWKSEDWRKYETVLLDEDAPKFPIVQVEHYSDSYAVITRENFEVLGFADSWVKVMQAVKRLAGESS